MLETAPIARPAVDDSELAVLLTGTLPSATVVNVDWVNLREEGNKQSASLAAIDAGEKVYVISEGHGVDNGWTYVLWLPEGAQPRMGYIWWSL